MKLKYFIFFIGVLLTAFACDEGDDGSIGKEAQAFVGEWICTSSSSSPNWSFQKDGTCILKGNSTETGRWSYDSKTKRLATTCLNWSWDVQIVTASEWSGVSISGKKVYSYKRSGGDTGTSTGSIKVENKYSSSSSYGSINSIAIIDSNGRSVKTSTSSVSKGSSKTFDMIPVGTYTVRISVNDRLGPKLVSKENIKVTKGKTTTVTFS